MTLLTPRVLIVVSLLYYLVRSQQHGLRDRKAEGFGRLEVDDHLELGGLLYREIAGLVPLRILSIWTARRGLLSTDTGP